MKILRFILAAPVAIPLLTISFLFGWMSDRIKYLGVLGIWLLGLQVNVG